MKSDLDIFSLKHRIFLVKHFYQAMGDYISVRRKYEKIYKKDSPEFSVEALDEFIRLFEDTGCVFKWKEELSDVNFPFQHENQIEQIYLNEKTTLEGVDDTTSHEGLEVKVETEEDTFLSDDFPEDEPQFRESENIPTTDENTNSGVFMCDLCGKDIRGLKKFKKHQMTHTENTPYVCDLCGKVFTGSKDFDKHQGVHSKNGDSTSGQTPEISEKMKSDKCRKRSKNTEMKRKAIIDAHLKNPEFNYSKIAELTESSRATTRNVILRFKETHTVARKPGCGKKMGFQDTHLVERILDIFKRIPEATVRDVALNMGVSPSLVHKIKKRNGVKSVNKPIANRAIEETRKTKRKTQKRQENISKIENPGS
ncbi:uncharacterized protein DMENIID0001_012270 [Sergentomyia squamirostris]